MKLMSYNILCDGYIKSQVEGTMRNMEKNARPWNVFDFDYRQALLKAEIIQSDSDILCFQEVDHASQIQAMLLTLGYESHVATVRQQVDHVTGLVAFKRDLYELLY